MGSGQHQGEGEVIFLWGEMMATVIAAAQAADPNFVPKPPPPPTWKDRLVDAACWFLNGLVASLFVVTPVLLFLMILFAAFPDNFVQLLRSWK